MVNTKIKSGGDNLETDRMLYELLDDELKVNLDEEVEAPPISISFGTHSSYSKRDGSTIEQTPIGTDGNFSFVQAPPKTMKTFFVSLLVSSYLKSGNKFGTSKMKSNRKDRDVLHFDTEQGRWHCLRGFRKVSDMANAENDKGYHSYSLRKIDYKTRLGFIEYKLEQAKKGSIGLVIIDGLADLVVDVNNMEESNLCVQKLMLWSTKYNCHIITVIHSNYGSDKPTGHLGSTCEKKSECQISLSKQEENNLIVDVTCKRSRNRLFENFSFFINKAGFPEVIDTNVPDIDF